MLLEAGSIAQDFLSLADVMEDDGGGWRSFEVAIPLVILTYLCTLDASYQTVTAVHIGLAAFHHRRQSYLLHTAVRSFNFNRSAELVRTNLIWMEREGASIPKQAVGAMIQALSAQHFDLQGRFGLPTVISLPYEKKKEYPDYYEWIKIEREFIHYQVAYRGYGFEEGSH